jgi:hypothetical protein
MTKQEAIEALDRGEKITHKYFSPDEWVKKYDNNGNLILEDGVICSEWEFWYHRTQDFFNNGWEIYKTK